VLTTPEAPVRVRKTARMMAVVRARPLGEGLALGPRWRSRWLRFSEWFAGVVERCEVGGYRPSSNLTDWLSPKEMSLE